jgi:hypothetical protein
MLQTIGNRIEDNKRSIKLRKGNEYAWFNIELNFFEKQLEKNTAIQYRLTLYYINTLNEATQVGLIQAAKYLIKS